MSKHAATPTTDSLEAERFAAQMARTYGRRRNNAMQVQA